MTQGNKNVKLVKGPCPVRNPMQERALTNKMEIVELEIAGHDWKSLRCGCGRSAEHLAGDLLTLARAQSDSDVDRVALDDHVMVPPGLLVEPALPVVSVALAALADETSPKARFTFLETLLFMIAGEGQTFELQREGRDLPAECAAAAQGGTWLLYREVFSAATIGAASYAYEILTLIDHDEERLDRVRVAAGVRLSEDLR